MASELVSIALCTYNGEAYIKEQLDSLIDQTYPNCEIIIVDDCSKDGTVGILKQYADKYPQIKLHINGENLGYTKNFEKAINLCNGDYVALCAYFTRSDARDALLARLRVACGARARNATTAGYGPRFLHSTGQLHKGGANNGVFLQLVADAPEDLPVPGEAYSFATLRNAQALGDLQVLRRRGRRALRINLSTDIDAGLATLLATIEKA